MSYYQLPKQGMSPGYYQQLPAGTPGWQDAPVPGWGINPMRAGPRRVGVGAYAAPYDDNVPQNSAVLPRYVPIGASAASETTTYGVVALGVAGGIVAGLALGWLWFANKPMKSNRRRGSKKKEAEAAYRDYVKEELARGAEADLVGFEQFLSEGHFGSGGYEESYGDLPYRYGAVKMTTHEKLYPHQKRR